MQGEIEGFVLYLYLAAPGRYISDFYIYQRFLQITAAEQKTP
jgi:hypothetical protein